MTEKKSINWSAMANVWNCFEDMGLSPNRIDEIYESIASPILIVGGGAGLVPEYLLQKGHKVTAIDSCPEMIELAAKRGTNIEYTDFLNNSYNDNSFKTVILSTGTIDARSLKGESIDNLLIESRRVLRTGGKSILAYFIANPDMELIYEQLGLNQEPSNNGLLYQAKNIEEAKNLFLQQEDDKSRINQIFLQYSNLISEHQQFVKNVGKAAEDKGYNPLEFISQNFSFKTFDLSIQDEKKLIDRCMKYFKDFQHKTLSDNETGIIIGEYK
jgi:ubiquinone/menaquinone biosynthesis C-methylase UbiE